MKLIVAVDKHWGIGKNNKLLFRLKKDMAFFRETTTGKVVVVGANTLASFPNGALPNRVNIVLDSSAQFHRGATTVATLAELDKALAAYPTNDIFVIGGASVYRLLVDRCDVAYVTKVDADGHADAFFPDLDARDGWQCQSMSAPTDDNGYTITFCTYVCEKNRFSPRNE